MAKTATLARRIEAEDSGVAVLRFRSGALGVIEVTDAHLPAEPRGVDHDPRREGHGEDRRHGGEQGGALAVRGVRRRRQAGRDAEATTNPPSVYGFGHEAYYRNVLAVLRGEARPTRTAAAGRKSLELILGIYESAKTGREVPLPLRPRL